MISEVEEREGGSKSKEKKGGRRPGYGSWASQGVFRPETFTNEVRNFLQLFVANIPIFCRTEMSAIQGRPTRGGRLSGSAARAV